MFVTNYSRIAADQQEYTVLLGKGGGRSFPKVEEDFHLNSGVTALAGTA